MAAHLMKTFLSSKEKFSSRELKIYFKRIFLISKDDALSLENASHFKRGAFRLQKFSFGKKIKRDGDSVHREVWDEGVIWRMSCRFEADEQATVYYFHFVIKHCICAK